MEHAETLLKNDGEDVKPSLTRLFKARHLFLGILNESTPLEDTLRQRIYWDLMIVEKELGCHKGSTVPSRLKHVDKAEEYVDELAQIALHPNNVGVQLQVNLERSILKGIKASLELRQGADEHESSRKLEDALKDLHETITELETGHPERYRDIRLNAHSWWERLSKKAILMSQPRSTPP